MSLRHPLHGMLLSFLRSCFGMSNQTLSTYCLSVSAAMWPSRLWYRTALLRGVVLFTCAEPCNIVVVPLSTVGCGSHLVMPRSAGLISYNPSCGCPSFVVYETFSYFVHGDGVSTFLGKCDGLVRVVV